MTAPHSHLESEQDSPNSIPPLDGRDVCASGEGAQKGQSAFPQANSINIDRNGAFDYEEGDVGPNGTVPPEGDVGSNGTVPPDGDVGPNGTVPPDGDVGPNGTVPPDGDVGPNGTVPPDGDVGPSGTVPPDGDIAPSGTVQSKGNVGVNGTVPPLDDSVGGRKGEHQKAKGWKIDDVVLNGRYRVLQVAGKGGMGIVYKCKKINTGEIVALKTVLSGGRMSAKDMEQFRKNYELVKSLNHDNIIRVNAMENDKATGQRYIEMDWIEGESLETHFRQFGGDRKLVAHETVRVLRKVADALDYAHGKGVVHRDVKDANIMIDKMEGKVLLIDFGIASREIRPFGTTNALKPEVEEVTVDFNSGTPGYQSPEQWEGKRPNPASDQYSLAVTAYRCLSGHLPFIYRGKNENAFRNMVLNEDVPPIQWLGEQTNGVLMKAMSRMPEERYGSCAEFIVALENNIVIEGVKEKSSSKEDDDGLQKGNRDGRKKEFDEHAFFILWAQVEEYYEAYKKAEWDRGQTFGSHLELFKKAWRAAVAAATKFHKLSKAYEFLLEAENEWKWLVDNKRLREQTARHLADVRQIQEEVDTQKAWRYAKDDYQEACRRLSKAEELFEVAEFEKVDNEINEAEERFNNALDAKNGLLKCLEMVISKAISQNDFASAEKSLQELEEVDGKKAVALAEKMEIAKTKRVVSIEDAISDALSQYDFVDAENTLIELKKLDASEARMMSLKIKESKTDRILFLEKSIGVAVSLEDFELTDKDFQELARWDAEKASVVEPEIKAAKHRFIEKLEKTISDAVLRDDYSTAEQALKKLEKVDSTKTVFQTAKIEAAKMNYINNLEASITFFLDKNDFPRIDNILLKLETLDAAKAADLTARIVAAKKIIIEDMEASVQDTLSQKKFNHIGELLDKMELLDTAKANELKEKVTTEKANYIHELKATISDAVSQNDFEEAELRLHELDILDPKAAAEIKIEKECPTRGTEIFDKDKHFCSQKRTSLNTEKNKHDIECETVTSFNSKSPDSCTTTIVDSSDHRLWLDVVMNAGDKISSGRYTVLSSIGKGGIGHVYKAHDNIEDVDVALKIVHARKHESMDKTLNRMQAQLKWIQNLIRHSGIVCAQRLELDDEEGLWFVVMDYVEGKTLRDYIRGIGKNGCLDFSETVRICRQIAEALDYMHLRGVIHCDVKSTNILIRDNKELDAVLIDFDLVEKLDDNNMVSRVGHVPWGGTIGYMSPEQAKGEVLTPASDLFSLAVTAYHCLSGRLPFRNEKKDLLLYQESILYDDVPAIKSLPSAANAVLKKALAKRPSDRYSTCVVFIDELEKGLSSLIGNKSSNAVAGKISVVVDGVELNLVKIKAGSFMMGSPEEEAERCTNERQHKVTLTKDFWLGQYEVTQEQYRAVMNTKLSDSAKGGKYPMENVSWEKAMEFCMKLTQQERKAGRLPDGYEYSLPTEAQWEYACRAGTMTPFSFGTTLNGDKANCNGDYPYGMQAGKYLECTVPVGSYAPNAWGLYDMHGNVWEWCRDVYEKDYAKDHEFLHEQPNRSIRVFRGGSWLSRASFCRSAYREGGNPANFNFGCGFRVALVPVQR